MSATAASTVAARRLIGRLLPTPVSGRPLLRGGVPGLRFRPRRRRRHGNRRARRKRVLDESAERGETVLQANLLAFGLGPSEIGDRNLEDKKIRLKDGFSALG